MVVLFTIGQSLSFIVTMAEEGLLAAVANEMLNMPTLSQGRDNPFLDGTMAGPADRDSHCIVTTKTEQLPAHFTGLPRQFDVASFALEMIWMI